MVDLLLKYFIHFHFIGLLNSTLPTMYTEASDKIEKAVETTKMALVKITPAGITIPTFFACFAAYYTTDLGTDAFVLPLPTMW